MKRRKGLLDEEKFLPPLPEQLPRGVSSLPGYGQTSAVAQGLLGFTGRNPTYSVMDPQAQQMSDAYRLGEQASVASQLYGSMLPFAAASTMASAQRAGSLLSPLTVFHGSPHKFSKFDASKIGTGEGAQAYGHGLYFAESPAVAKGYQSRLAGGTDPYQYQYQGQMYEPSSEKNPVTHALGLIYHQGSKFAQNIAKQGLKDAKAGDAFALDMGGVDYYQRMLDVAKTAKKSDIQATQGAFYKVDLPDEQIAKMLDWDKPLSQQPEAVQKLAKEYGLTKNASGTGEAKGSYIYQTIANRMAQPPFNEKSPYSSGAPIASDKLKELGIPGIRYLDQGSRGKGGTSNFVVFPGEESKLRIMEVNGKPVVIDEEELRRSGLLGVSSNAPLSKELPNPGEAVEQFLLAKYPNVDISVYGKDKIHLGKIVVPKDQRNKGLGTQIMNDLVQQADEIGATVTLSPASDFGGSKERLKDFYKRFGFVQNTGRNKDFSIRESMYRIPKEKVSPETPQNETDLLAGIGTVGAGLLSPAVLEYLRRRDEEGM